MQATLNILREKLKRITYKPNVTISIDEMHSLSTHLHHELVLNLDYHVPDSTKSDRQTVMIRHTHRAPMDLIADDFERWVFQAITRAEMHEAQEWYRIDGVVLEDPHAQDWPQRGS